MEDWREKIFAGEKKKLKKPACSDKNNASANFRNYTFSIVAGAFQRQGNAGSNLMRNRTVKVASAKKKTSDLHKVGGKRGGLVEMEN